MQTRKTKLKVTVTKPAGQTIDMAMTSYLEGIDQVNNESSSVQSYTALKRGMMSEVIMYGEEVYPKSVELITNVRLMMADYSAMRNSTELRTVIKDMLKDSVDLSKSANTSVQQHMFVIGNLRKLGKDIGETESNVSSDAEGKKTEAKKNKGKSLWWKGGAVAAASTVVLAPLGYYSYKEGTKAQKLSAQQTSEARVLTDAVSKIDNVKGVCKNMKTMIDALAKKLIAIETNVRRVSRSIGRADEAITHGENATVETYFRWIQEQAAEMIPECDKYLSTTVDYSGTLRRIRETEPINERFRIDWLERMQSDQS
jgi:hypothetical protein